jgi:hypothetical protein
MTSDPSTRIMDKIFQSDSDEAKGRMLKILHDFLVSEASKHAEIEKEKGAFLSMFIQTSFSKYGYTRVESNTWC